MNEYFNICHEYIFISFSIVAISVNLDLTLTLPGEVPAPHPQTLWLAPSLAGWKFAGFSHRQRLVADAVQADPFRHRF
jgi:hypothetical protein